MMKRRCTELFLILLTFSSNAFAQEPETLPDPDAAPAAPTPAPSTRADVEPVPEIIAPPAHEAGAEPLSAPQLPAAPVPEPEVVEPPTMDATLEVSIGVSPRLGLDTGGLGSLGYVSGWTDFVFAVDPRVFLGAGLRMEYWENETTSSASVEVPLIAQVYLDTPRRGEATPTLRFIPALRWDTDMLRTRLGGSFVFAVGVTWFATEWLAIRLLGSVGGGVSVATEGLAQVSAFASVGGDIGVVVRL